MQATRMFSFYPKGKKAAEEDLHKLLFKIGMIHVLFLNRNDQLNLLSQNQFSLKYVVIYIIVRDWKFSMSFINHLSSLAGLSFFSCCYSCYEHFTTWKNSSQKKKKKKKKKKKNKKQKAKQENPKKEEVLLLYG